MISRFGLLTATLLCAIELPSCGRQAKMETPAPAVIDTHWTKSAAERAQRLTEAALKQDPQRGGMEYALPQLRVYDANGQLVYLLDPTRGWSAESIGSFIDKAVARGQPMAGPSLKETLADLQTADGKPASAVVAANGTPLVFDYWASWCVPCKFLEKALLKWQASKQSASAQIIKAEADPMKLAKESGEKIFMVKNGSDGKLHKVEMK